MQVEKLTGLRGQGWGSIFSYLLCYAMHSNLNDTVSLSIEVSNLGCPKRDMEAAQLLTDSFSWIACCSTHKGSRPLNVQTHAKVHIRVSYPAIPHIEHPRRS